MNPGYTVYLDQLNPYGSLQAKLEDDGRVIYLYVFPPNDPEEMKALWIANRVAAPQEPDHTSAPEGFSPLMHRDACVHPDGIAALDSSRLSIIWFEEGDGLGLFQDDRLIAVMPPWSGSNGFYGHSAEAATEQDLAWPLSQGARQTFEARLRKAKLFWDWRLTDQSWRDIQEAGLDFLERRLGKQQRYWAADGGLFPPLAVAQFLPEAYPGVAVYATLGMSAQPMPQVEMYHEDPVPFRRIELVMAAKRGQDWPARSLANLVRYPWNLMTWLGRGHTVTAPVTSDAVLLWDAPPPQRSGMLFSRKTLPPPDLSGKIDSSGDPVTFLWAFKISLDDREFAQSQGSAKLIEKLKKQGRSWIHE